MKENEVEQLADELSLICAQGKAMEVFSMSEDQARSYGTFEETALSEEELDEIYAEFLRNCFIKNEKARSQ